MPTRLFYIYCQHIRVLSTKRYVIASIGYVFCTGNTRPQGKREEGAHNMYAAIRRYQTDPDSVEEVARQVNEGFVPLISDMQGFVAYFALNAGQGEFGSVSVFEDQQSAEESNRVAEDWVNQNLSELLPTPPDFAAGDVVAYKAK
jgi:hypothetical protein